jgi:antitoxin component YwqK of YwqJK toxin-antitoxin module
MQIIDRNGFTETISIKDRLTPYQSVDFLSPQPYQKVLRVYGKNPQGKSTSKISSYHNNGHIWQLLDVVDGRAHGIYQEWYSNGQLRIQAFIIEGLADINDLAQTSWVFNGKSEVWDEQGNPIAEILYEKGLLHGPSSYFYPNGQLSQLIPYHQGNIHGETIRYDEEGNVLERVPFLQGQKQGSAFGKWSESLPAYEEQWDKGILLSGIYFNPQGEKIGEVVQGNGTKPLFQNNLLASRLEYQKGIQQGIIEDYYPNGELRCSYHVLDGKKQGEEWEYYSSSTKQKQKPKLNLHWHEDQIEGQVKTWYENGTLESQREIHQQKKQGLSFAWYKNGDLMMVEDYANDLLIKGSYFKRGDKTPVSKIEEGKGLATLFTSDGVFWKKIPYEKGKPILHDDHHTR